MEQNIGMTERIASMAAGTFFLFRTFSRKKPLEGALSFFLLLRGVSGHSALYDALKIETLDPVQPVSVETTLAIDQPRKKVYAFWRNLKNLPLFMSHLKSVVEFEDDTSLWKAKIPGKSLEWESEILNDIPNEYISWESLPGSQIENRGEIWFHEGKNRTTDVQLKMTYRAPAGKMGENVAKLINPFLEEAILKDIRNSRNYLETGKVPAQA